jgi:hypothetical protein
MAIGDVNGNGRPDLYLNHHTNIPAELTVDFATRSPVHGFLRSLGGKPPNDQHGATFFDIDQDGDLDLLEARGGGADGRIDPGRTENWNEVYINLSGRLVVDNKADDYGIEYGPARGRMITPMNLDGRLSLYLGTKLKADGSYPPLLMRMTSDGTFVRWEGLNADLNGFEWAVGAHVGGYVAMFDVIRCGPHRLAIDLDASNGVDGRDKIVVDYGTRVMSDVQVADFDGDRDAEIFVAMLNSSSHLYEIRGRKLIEISSAAGLVGTSGGLRSATTGDFDNDGDIDIAGLRWGRAVSIAMLINDGKGHFTVRDVVATGPRTHSLADEIVSGDFNGDGVLDLLISNGLGGRDSNPASPTRASGGYTLLEGRDQGYHWLAVDLRGEENETFGLGARVVLRTTDGLTPMMEQDSGVHKFAQDAQSLHFGLGDNGNAVRIAVTWPDSHRQFVPNVTVDRKVVVAEETGTLIVERTGRVVTVTADSEAWVSLPGSIEVRGSTPRALTPIGLESDDRLEFSGGKIVFDLIVAPNGADSFSFNAASDADLRINGAFDLVFL